MVSARREAAEKAGSSGGGTIADEPGGSGLVLRLATVGLLTSVLAGCAVDKVGCNPAVTRTADFFTKLSCDLSGSYEARAQDQQQELAQAQARNQALQSVLLQLQAEQRDLTQGLVIERARRDRLVRALNGYITQVDQQATQNALLQKQVRQARQEVERLASLPASSPSATQQQALAKVQKEVETLRAMLP